MLETRKGMIVGEPCRAESREAIAALHAELDTAKRPDGGQPSAASCQRLADYVASADAQVAECDDNEFRAVDRRIKEDVSLDLGGRRVDIRHLGRGNTAGDLIAYVPDAGTVITGDVVVWPFPFATESYISEWARVLRRIENLKAGRIVPGHGAPLRDGSYLRTLAELFESLARQARAVYRPGMTLDELKPHIDLVAFRDRIGHNDKFIEANFDRQMASAIERMWQELSGQWKPEGN